MSDQNVNYDNVKNYRLEPEREQELLNTGGECTFIWANKAGHPMGVTSAYVAVGDKIWMTATRDRVRIKAIARDGRSAIVITSKGTPMGGGKTVSYKGHTVIHDDSKTKLWMYNILAQTMVQEAKLDPENTFTKDLDPELFIRFLNTPERIVMEFTKEMSIPFDGDKMAAGTAQAYAEFAAEDAKNKQES
ncbi:hypothetical protein SIN8267_01242 [Sinobacterium norvegicum]|uniref:Pyridoxamine 5'-phosphate oxidase putative domain-containing protein n=1 Tax=Sinobacterium norvegicum TaxID=1641715 RepID=A0ABM9AD68_9GAMM|nr:hypothetical protein [Sinobacterium norvegicum]CAH0991140.1 hypothetical protein SIN8267_01242 [Sinobacterium norvegicum]